MLVNVVECIKDHSSAGLINASDTQGYRTSDLRGNFYENESVALNYYVTYLIKM